NFKRKGVLLNKKYSFVYLCLSMVWYFGGLYVGRVFAPYLASSFLLCLLYLIVLVVPVIIFQALGCKKCPS
ncbi:hypothetical protein, partial [Helicobacter felis]|uniref:hypothetical protein n=1 Tax=Helicobacter felis TaxID=214 RepID=UPI001F34A283